MKWRVKTKEEFVTSGQWVTDMNIPRYKGYPAGWNKQRRNEPPRDKCANVGHNHVGEKTAKILYLDLGIW